MCGRSAGSQQLLLLASEDTRSMARRLEGLCARLDCATSQGLLAHPSRPATLSGTVRAAVVVGPRAEERAPRLRRLLGWLERDPRGLRARGGVFLGVGRERPRIGFLFPGQGGPAAASPDALGEPLAAAFVQPAIVRSSLTALKAARLLGIEASVAIGHSLGELTALHWAGALDESTLLRVASARGMAMAQAACAPGGMAGIHAAEETCSMLIAGLKLSVACRNGPRQHVVSGAIEDIERLAERAARTHIAVTRLVTTHAFHSQLMAPAVPAFESSLESAAFSAPRRRVLSTVTGAVVAPDADLKALLKEQICKTVEFAGPGRAVASETDLLVELGPGRTLARLASALGDTPAVSIRSELCSNHGLLEVAGAAYAVGAPVRAERLPGAVAW